MCEVEIILEELNKIMQIDIYTKIEDNLFNVDIYIDKLYQEELIEYVLNKINGIFKINYKEIHNHICHISCFIDSDELSYEYILKIQQINDHESKKHIYFGQIDHYLSRLNVLIKRIYCNQYIYLLEFANNVERMQVYKYLRNFLMKIEMKDNYYKYNCKSIKIIKEPINFRDKSYFMSTDYVLEHI